MVERQCLVANKNMSRRVNNGSKSVIEVLGAQKVFIHKGVGMDCLGGHSMRLEKHLLWEVDGKSDWIEVEKKYGFKHVSNNSGLGKVKLSMEQFRN